MQIWQNSGSGCLLFYPGSLLEPRHYSLFIGELLARGFSVAGLHLPGHGLARSCKHFTFSSFLACGLDAESYLLEFGFGEVSVCGHSQGGILALAHAAASRACAAAFSICAVFPAMEKAIELTLFKSFAAKRHQIMEIINKLAAMFPGFPIPLPFYLSLIRICKGKKKPVIMGSGKGRISYPLAYLASLFAAEIPEGVSCPWWLFSARNDALFTPELVAEVFAKVGASQKTLVWLEDGGHMAILNPDICRYVAGEMAKALAAEGLEP